MKNLTLIIFVFLLFTISAFAQTEVEIYVEKANQYDSERKFDEAVAEISKAIAIEPNNTNLYLKRAGYYLILGKKLEILNDAQKAASINPTDKKILYSSALVLHRSRQYKEALKIADALFALGDVDSFGWSLRSQIKTHLEDFVGALDDVTTAVELFPQDTFLKQNQANLIRLLGDSEKALEMYDALIVKYEANLSKVKDETKKQAIKRDLSMFLFGRAGLHFGKFNKDQAQADLIKAVEYTPHKFNYSHRARIYKQQKMYAEALADLTTAIEFDKENDILLLLIDRGDVYFALRKYAEAIQDYEQVIKLDHAQTKELMQRRIALAKQKIQENGNQQK